MNQGAFRWMILLLMVPLVLSNTALWVSPAPLLTAIQQGLSVDIGKAGTLVTLITLISGIFMFSGSMVIDRLGPRMAAVIAMSLLAIGAGLAYFATSYVEILGTRVLVGIGVGLVTPLPGALTMAWFPAREQPYINSFATVLGYIGMSLAFGGAASLLVALGNWQNVLAAFAIIPMLGVVGWLTLGRNPPLTATAGELSAGGAVNPESGLSMAARRPEVWLLTATMLGQMWAFNTFSTFLPTFLEIARGLSRADAGGLSSLLPLSGLAGALICGLGTGIVGLRKPFLWPLVVAELIAALTIVNFPVGPLVYVAIAVFGFAQSGVNVPLMTVVMDLKGATPQMIGGAFALLFGIGFTVSFFVSPLFGALVPMWGMPMTMTVFSLPILIAITALIILPETGPKAHSRTTP